MRALSQQASAKLERICANTQIPSGVRIFEQRRAEHPFQGEPPNRSYRVKMKKRWKRLSERERMLAFGWLNPAAGEFLKLPHGEQRDEFIKEHPTVESRGWLNAQYRPLRTLQVSFLEFYRKHRRPPDDIWQLLGCTGYEEAIANVDESDPGEFALSIISPVTGEVLEFSADLNKVTPGNLLIVPVPSERLEYLGSDVVMQDAESGQFVPISKLVEVLFYYQVYGEDGVIRTGDFGIKKDGGFYFM